MTAETIDCYWQSHEGRDRDGEKFCHQVIVHASGRILARIICPLNEEYGYGVYFCCSAFESDTLRDGPDLEFIDLDAAKECVVEVLATTGPFATKPGQETIREKHENHTSD